MKISRWLYLGYYLYRLDWRIFHRFLHHVSSKKRKLKSALIFDIVSNSIRYNISLLEYFQFRFFEIEAEEKEQWAGTGYMYEYQKLMNPKKSRVLLSNKELFLTKYSKFLRHSFVGIEELKSNPDLANVLINGTSDKVVLKSVDGQCGRGIQVIPVAGLTPSILIAKLEASNNDLAEEFVQQHEELELLSPSGLNTLRIVTQINKEGGVDVITTRLRITVNSCVDNLAAGNLAAEVDMGSGKVIGTAVYSDITKEDETIHPVTGVLISGFEVPFFKEAIEMVKEAALLFPENRSIGWDVAITNNGPELIEGNHDWCKLLWQLPTKRGLKHVLEPYK